MQSLGRWYVQVDLNRSVVIQKSQGDDNSLTALKLQIVSDTSRSFITMINNFSRRLKQSNNIKLYFIQPVKKIILIIRFECLHILAKGWKTISIKTLIRF